MADFSVTINNSMNVLGIEPPSLWGVMQWGEHWGYGDIDLPVDFGKFLDDSLTLDSSVSIDDFAHIITESFSFSSSISSITLVDLDGYFTVFKGGVTNAENRISTSYTEATGNSSTWTPVTNPSTSWS